MFLLKTSYVFLLKMPTFARKYGFVDSVPNILPCRLVTKISIKFNRYEHG